MVEKYIIMAGGNYKHWEKPRHLSIINDEELIGRTIRLLKENGIKDISISTDNPVFEKFELPILKHDNLYNCMWYDIEEGEWFNCFYPTNEPVCYIFGDVYFSDEAIKTIVETETDDIQFFGSKSPFADNYIKTHEEPFALKVANQEHLHKAIEKTKKLEKEGKFWRKPIMWELWSVINNASIEKGSSIPEYKVINDYTCDIDWEEDIMKMNRATNKEKIKLSIIIPYYKTCDLTIQLLDVLIPQLTEETEVFLIDDGCNETKLDKYKNKIKIIHLEENVGSTKAMNIGIKQAHGEYISIIDSDDMISTNYIKVLLETINKRKEDVIFFDWQDINTKEIVHHPSNYAPWKAIYKYNIMPLFREGWRYSYDVPFQEDLDKKNYTRYYIEEILYYYNSTREDNLTHEKEKLLKAERIKNMIKVEVIKEFTLNDFDKIMELKRSSSKNKEGSLFVGDTFYCSKEMVDYLTGNNAKGIVVVKVIEVVPVKETSKVEALTDNEEPIKEVKPKTSKKKKKK